MWIDDEKGDLIDAIPFCSDPCHRDYAEIEYAGWNGCHEAEFTNYCQNCGVVIPGFMDACKCQFDNVLVNRFLSEEGEKCKHGNWIQVPASYIRRDRE